MMEVNEVETIFTHITQLLVLAFKAWNQPTPADGVYMFLVKNIPIKRTHL